MNLKIPPAIVFLVCLGATFGIYFLAKDFSYVFPYKVLLSRVFLGAGVISVILGILAFRVKGTTVDPTKPNKASSLVTHGIYQYTRNPMYLGMALVLIGGIVRMGNPLCLLALLLFTWYLTRFQIKPEEKALFEIFGEEYESYCKKVRRWM